MAALETSVLTDYMPGTMVEYNNASKGSTYKLGRLVTPDPPTAKGLKNYMPKPYDTIRVVSVLDARDNLQRAQDSANHVPNLEEAIDRLESCRAGVQSIHRQLNILMKIPGLGPTTPSGKLVKELFDDLNRIFQRAITPLVKFKKQLARIAARLQPLINGCDQILGTQQFLEILFTPFREVGAVEAAYACYVIYSFIQQMDIAIGQLNPIIEQLQTVIDTAGAAVDGAISTADNVTGGAVSGVMNMVNDTAGEIADFVGVNDLIEKLKEESGWNAVMAQVDLIEARCTECLNIEENFTSVCNENDVDIQL